MKYPFLTVPYHHVCLVKQLNPFSPPLKKSTPPGMPGTPRAASIAAWEQGKSVVSIAMGLHQKWMGFEDK